MLAIVKGHRTGARPAGFDLTAFFFVILAAGIGNAVLRPGIGDPLTLYRILAPLGLLVLLALDTPLTLKALGAYAVFAAYNFALATAYGHGYSQLLPSLVHYFYLMIPLVLMIHLKANVRGFDESYLRFVRSFYFFLLANLLLEFLIGEYYPNLEVDESDEPGVRAFFWNQNDLAVVLCVIGWFYLTLDRFKGFPRAFAVVVTIFLLYYNDSKAALISFCFFSLPIWLIFWICSAFRIRAFVWISLCSLLGAIFISALVAFRDYDIHFAYQTYSIDDLLLKPIMNVLTLQSTGEWLGSLNNRTDAAIFAIIEYLRTYGFGMGAGGSWLVLTLPQYELGGALSPHNALLQFIVDFGYPVLLGYLTLTVWALRRLFRHRLAEYEKLKVMAILSFPTLGMSQSGAIVTNFFFFSAVYFIWLLDSSAKPHANAARRVGRSLPASRTSAQS